MRCKFYKKCKYASPNSYTCTQDGGGEFCGAFRDFQKSKNEKNDYYYEEINSCLNELLKSSSCNKREL